MKILLIAITTAGLLLDPFTASAVDNGPPPSQAQQAPPVAQALVREGDFAIKLAAMLDLGQPTEEIQAEDLLTSADIMPLNGWLSDYPVTPEIVGQLQASIAQAASKGKLPMKSEEATRGLYSLAGQMGLPTPAGDAGPPSAGQPPPQAPLNPQVINNYYYDQGPPIMTYYAPPVDYFYLYDWVPYPAFWFGFWYPGFYICHNFTTTVIVSGRFDHDGFPRRRIVTNHIIDPVTRRVAVVDPIARTTNGTLRTTTILRTPDGSVFRTFADLRKGSRMTEFRPETRGRTANAAIGNRGFKDADASRSAGRIYSRSVERKAAQRAEHDNAGRSPGRVAPERPAREMPARSDRTYLQPRVREGSTGERPRGMRDSERTYAPALRTPSRSFEELPAAPHNGREVMRPSSLNRQGNGGDNGFMGRDFRGAACKGRC